MQPFVNYMLLFASVLYTDGNPINVTKTQSSETTLQNDIILDAGKALKDLEREKNELIIKINSAIKESENLLKQYNDTNSNTGLKHLEKLKEYFNETVKEDAQNDVIVNASRRNQQQPRYIQKGKVKLDLFDIASLFGNKKDKVSDLVREQNQNMMKQKLKDWMKDREKERKKVKEYKEKMNLIFEKCPNNGLGPSKTESKKKKSRRALDRDSSGEEEERRKIEERKQKAEKSEKKKKKLLANRKKYPCCRKCCKKSYLGCL